MSAAQLAEDEFPARTALKAAQERLAKALEAADAAGEALARGKEHLGVLERLREEARAEIVDEARALAETFEEHGACEIVGASAKRDREIKDELVSFELAFDILVQKNASAQREIVDAEAGVEAGIKAVVAEEISPILSRM